MPLPGPEEPPPPTWWRPSKSGRVLQTERKRPVRAPAHDGGRLDPLPRACGERSEEKSRGPDWQGVDCERWLLAGGRVPGQGVPVPPVTAAWTDWLAPAEWGLQLHMNCLDPLGEGSWRFVLRLVAFEIARRLGLEPEQVVMFGATQANDLRPRLHLHSLIALGRGVVDGRLLLLGLDRWRGSDALGPWIQQRLASVHAFGRPFDQEANRASVTLKPVVPRGSQTDPYALVNYVVRYLLREDEQGSWITVGDLGTVLS